MSQHVWNVCPTLFVFCQVLNLQNAYYYRTNKNQITKTIKTMKKKLLFLFGALILSIGGASAQTALAIEGGYNTTITYDSNDDHYANASVQFKENVGNNNDEIGRSCIGGDIWAATFTEGEVHTFTVVVANNDNSSINLCIAALPSAITDQYKAQTIIKSASINTGTEKTLTFEISEAYGAVYLYTTNANWNTVKIASITRTVSTSDAVGKPTITAPATYDGDETEVTITPGKNTHHVKYTISGSNEDVTNKEITEETVVTLTGSGDITITAVGFNEDGTESSAEAAVTITYSNVLPSGTTVVWEDNQAFSSWSDNLAIDKNMFADLEVGDYIFLYATHDGAVPNIGFRNNWDASVFETYTETSGGNCAYGNMTAEEEYWWMKVTDETLLNLFKNGTPRIQGQNFTLTKVEIHKAKTVSEAVDNEIAKYENVILNLTRSFNTGGWNTICLPFVPTAAQATEMFGDGYKLAAFTGAEGTTMKFSTITIANFEAGKPYLVKPTQSKKNKFTFFDVDITVRKATPVTFGDYTFVGVFTKKSFEKSEWPTTRFVGAGNKLMTPNSTDALNALRAYFQIADANAAPVLSIDGEDGEATGIRSIENGQLTIDNEYYDLSGRRVVKPTKGVYIMNGKKVILK